MHHDDVNSDNKDNGIPDTKPELTQTEKDDLDDSLAQAGSEPGDTHPVFGNDVQPQEIVDKEVIGTNDADGEPFKVDNTAANFDPENDPRMQDQPDE